MDNVIKLGKATNNAKILEVEDTFKTAQDLHKEYNFNKCIIILQKDNAEDFNIFRVMNGMNEGEAVSLFERVKFDIFTNLME